MIKMLQLSCYNFFMIKICSYEKKKQYQIKLGKTCYMTKPFRHNKIKDTKKFKRIKKKKKKKIKINSLR